MVLTQTRTGLAVKPMSMPEVVQISVYWIAGKSRCEIVVWDIFELAGQPVGLGFIDCFSGGFLRYRVGEFLGFVFRC